MRMSRAWWRASCAARLGRSATKRTASTLRDGHRAAASLREVPLLLCDLDGTVLDREAAFEAWARGFATVHNCPRTRSPG